MPPKPPVKSPRLRALLLILVVVVLCLPIIAKLVARTEGLEQHRESIETYSALILVTAMALALAEMWRRKVPLRRYGSVIDPKKRPMAYALCMGFLTLFLGFLAAFGWVRLVLP